MTGSKVETADIQNGTTETVVDMKEEINTEENDSRRMKFFVGAELFTMVHKCTVLVSFLRLIRKMMDALCRGVFKWIYRGPKEELPAIKDLLLLDSASSLAIKIRTKKVKSVAVVKAYIERIKDVNELLNCIVDDRFEAAIQEAMEVDEFLDKGKYDESTLAVEKPFLGVPFTVKDSFCIAGLKHTAGCYERRNAVAECDAEVVSLMRRAGAIPLGVTNVPELCMWWETNNRVYGRTNNPYDTTRIVGGSSGGEACASAAAATPFGIGSDIGGSIRMPAFFCGVFGHKPTSRIGSPKGHIPYPYGELADFMVVGPISRYCCDLIPMLKVLAGDGLHKLRLEEPVDLSQLKIYYMEDDGGFPFITAMDGELRFAMKKVVSHFEKAYRIKTEKIELQKMARAIEMWSYKMAATGTKLSDLVKEQKGSFKPWCELLKWCVGSSSHTFPIIQLGLMEKGPGSYFVDEHENLINMCNDFKMELNDMLGANGILLYPSHPTTAMHHNQPLFAPLNFVYPAIFNMLEVPVTQCPLGLSSENVPLGIQVVAARYNDHLTIAIAAELERTFGGWVPPSGLPE